MTEESNTWKQRIIYTDRAPDDRSRMRAVANNLILHLHPTKVPAPALRWRYTWGLGGLSAMLATMLVVTGVLLMFRYDASVERAYTSIQWLETQVAFGSLIRGIHHWSANLLVITTFLHLLRVFFTGGFKEGRNTNWTVGLLLLLLIVAFNFTGYLLPWDQLAFWAITVGTSLLAYLPAIGESLTRYLLAGPEVGQGALRNFYAIHVAVLPAILVALLSYHFWRVRKDGGISQPKRAPRERVERLTTIPHLVRIELAAAVTLIAGILLFATLVPAPLAALADPTHPPNPAKAAWYFLGLQELLLHMHPLAAMVLAGALLLVAFLLPRWDREEADVGIYFRSPTGRWAALVGSLLSGALIPLLVVLDEYWLDLSGWLPAWPTLITTGLIPLLLSLGALALIYFFLRLSLQANRSEATAGLFAFVVTSLILLTLVGIYLRGPNMALTVPFLG